MHWDQLPSKFDSLPLYKRSLPTEHLIGESWPRCALGIFSVGDVAIPELAWAFPKLTPCASDSLGSL